MPYVVGKECLSCKSTVCVDVCPVDAFRDADYQLVICPDTCIECGVCEPECPVDAIINPEEYTGENHDVITLNSELSKTSPVIFKSVTAQ
ncbi:indolepyruvate ferredoxin oxidoreductase subunit alpha [Pseudomonas serboccidentalis]|uniref:indolepyruvate ferredoxin oxidoreductase subunit alpha n=1 Tax=Pseudomonas serboccidentalis TaxID=2964670 RepID=UPI0039DF3ADB